MRDGKHHILNTVYMQHRKFGFFIERKRNEKETGKNETRKKRRRKEERDGGKEERNL